MIINVEQYGVNLRVSYFNADGEIAYVTVPVEKHDQFIWEYAQWQGDKRSDPKFLSWDGRGVRRVPSTRLTKYRIEEILMDLPKETHDVLFASNTPRKHFVDIETEITDGFPDPETALNRVLAIGIANDQRKVFLLGIKDLSEQEFDWIKTELNAHFRPLGDTWDVQYLKYDSEYDMMYTFFNKLIHRMHCITGWNVIDYDWQYMLNRCARLNIDPSSASVSRRLIGKNRLPQHRMLVDYMEIVKKWDRVIKIKESFKLDHIAEQAVGLKKVKYNGSLRELYDADHKKFLLYNAIDCALVYYIDKRLGTMSTFLKLANVARVEAQRAFSPIATTEAMMTREFKRRNRVIIDASRDDKDGGSFEGAYVKDPVPGLHEWVACYDFASLYPNSMIQFNISPEAYMGKGLDVPTGAVRSASGAIFDNREDSVLRTILKDLYGKRKDAKRVNHTIMKEIDELEHILRER